MDKKNLTRTFRQLQEGKLTVEAALDRLKHLPFEDASYAHIEHYRSLRHGMPEVIYCEGKTVSQVAGIAKRMLAAGSDILATRGRLA